MLLFIQTEPKVLIFCDCSILGIMVDGLHLTYTFWELLVWLSLGMYELAGSLEFISILIINQVSLLIAIFCSCCSLAVVSENRVLIWKDIIKNMMLAVYWSRTLWKASLWSQYHQVCLSCSRIWCSQTHASWGTYWYFSLTWLAGEDHWSWGLGGACAEQAFLQGRGKNYNSFFMLICKWNLSF